MDAGTRLPPYVVASPLGAGSVGMTKRRAVIRAAAMLFALMLAACASGRDGRCPDGGTRAIGETLYFGTASPAGAVSSERWEAFVASEITPRFPNGLTSWRANGQWLAKNGELQHEESYVLYVVHADTLENDAAIRAIIERYREAFQQEAVLRVRQAVCVSL
ncbi:MAG: DUF3574 domain-containing protein [Acidobacteria bacterium]|nr:DUF3574 domain-containing protein [Acidobacteriota bacterium]